MTTALTILVYCIAAVISIPFIITALTIASIILIFGALFFVFIIEIIIGFFKKLINYDRRTNK